MPVFYIGYAGGFGKEGLDTLTLLGSTDVTTATGINPRGDIVGRYRDAAGRDHGYLLAR